MVDVASDKHDPGSRVLSRYGKNGRDNAIVGHGPIEP